MRLYYCKETNIFLKMDDPHKNKISLYSENKRTEVTYQSRTTATGVYEYTFKFNDQAVTLREPPADAVNVNLLLELPPSTLFGSFEYQEFIAVTETFFQANKPKPANSASPSEPLLQKEHGPRRGILSSIFCCFRGQSHSETAINQEGNANSP